MTEKQYTPNETEKKIASKKVEDKNIAKAQVKGNKTKTPKETSIKKEDKVKNKETKKSEKKKIEVPKVKKEFAVVNGRSLPISTKVAVGICRFIKNKKIKQAISDLELVIVKKKPVPIRGELAHKKGPGKYASGSGKYPLNASKDFIRLLKSLDANTIVNGLDEPFISEAIANQASRPMGRFGRWQRKRTHVKIIAKDKKQNKEKENGRKKNN